MVDRKELGGTELANELVPGKLEVLYRYAQTLRDRATDVIADAEALKSIDTGAWTGPAYEAYAEHSGNQWPQWLKLGDAMAYGAQAIESYANCLGWAQMQANQAIELYRRGQQLTHEAQQAHNRTVAQYNSGQGDPAALPPVFSDPGEEYRQAARELLDRARRQLEAVAGESAKALNEMADAIPTEDEESTEETIAHALTDAAGLIPGIGEVVDLAHAGVYALQGKGTEAALTAAAAVPFVGWAAGGTKLGKAGKRIGEALGIGEKARFGWSDRIGKGAYRDNFFETYPDLKGQVVVHHAVEQAVITKHYPHLDIAPNEMHSLDNLRGIPNELNSKMHLSDIRKDWTAFYKENPNATKQDLLDQATKIDDKYGQQFRPPVR